MSANKKEYIKKRHATHVQVAVHRDDLQSLKVIKSSLNASLKRTVFIDETVRILIKFWEEGHAAKH